jgi:hypothetical protein
MYIIYLDDELLLEELEDEELLLLDEDDELLDDEEEELLCEELDELEDDEELDDDELVHIHLSGILNFLITSDYSSTRLCRVNAYILYCNKPMQACLIYCA